MIDVPSIKLVPGDNLGFGLSVIQNVGQGDYRAIQTSDDRWWYVHGGDPLKFPRRDRVGTIIDWRTQDKKPTIMDLAIGDVMTVPTWADPEFVDDPELAALEAEFALTVEPCTVSKVTNLDMTSFWRLTLQRVRKPPLVLRVHGLEELPPTLRKPQRRYDTRVTRHGPYRNPNTGHVAYFAFRSTPGRYPRWVSDYSRQGLGVMKAPAIRRSEASGDFHAGGPGWPNYEEWKQWEYEGIPGEYHPRDLIRRTQ